MVTSSSRSQPYFKAMGDGRQDIAVREVLWGQFGPKRGSPDF